MTHDIWTRALAMISEARAAERKELVTYQTGIPGIVRCGVATRYHRDGPYEIVQCMYANDDGTETVYTARYNTDTDALELEVEAGK